MPIYDYRCKKCGTFEYSQRITEEPLKTCPKCGADITRLISRNVGVVFKGSGWYCVDNRNDSQSNASGSASPTSYSTSTDTPSSTSTDTSSDSSTETEKAS